jgi:hypothetical protein
MSDSVKRWTGGCLCGALRYEAKGEPQFAGLCCCVDCRKASGSGFIPFLGFSSGAVQFTGRSLSFSSKAANGGDAVRNSARFAAASFMVVKSEKTINSRSTPAR